MSQSSSSCCGNSKRNIMEDAASAANNTPNGTINTPPPAGRTTTSPRSVVPTGSTPTAPPTKRQKQAKRLLCFEDEQKKTAAISILDFLQDDALTAHIFAFVGPKGTACCAQVCKTWNATSQSRPSLWRTFVQTDFGFSNTSTTKPWCSTYSYLADHYQQQPSMHLPARVLFADDGGNFPGYPAQHALSQNKSMVWCTHTGADRNVDLVLELAQPSLLTGFIAANGGRGYSAPLRDALVFVSIDPPQLDQARCYDIEENNSGGESLGSAWVQHLFREPPSTNTTAAVVNVQGEAALNILLGDPQAGAVQVIEALAAQENPVVGRNNNNKPDNNRPRPPSTLKDALQPVAAFSFPDLATAYHANSQQTLATPIVGRFIHFKLLTSHSPPGLEHISDNIDLMNFHSMGIPLTDAETILGFSSPPIIPDYPRQHPLQARPRNLAANNLEEIPLNDEEAHDPHVGLQGPWLDVDFF